MTEPLNVEARPCSSCPYRRDCPSGVWEETEYEKLPAYDEDAFPPALSLFLCHHSALGKAETVCRGWLSVHAESPAARLAVLTGAVTNEQRYADPGVPLFSSGAEAAAEGLEDVPDPGPRAQALIDGLVRKKAR